MSRPDETCAKLEELIYLYADDAAEPAEARLVEQHLGTCVSCRRLVGELRRLSEALAELPPPQPPLGFVARVRRATSAARPCWLQRAPESPPVASRWPVWRVAVAVAVAVLVLAAAMPLWGPWIQPIRTAWYEVSVETQAAWDATALAGREIWQSLTAVPQLAPSWGHSLLAALASWGRSLAETTGTGALWALTALFGLANLLFVLAPRLTRRGHMANWCL